MGCDAPAIGHGNSLASNSIRKLLHTLALQIVQSPGLTTFQSKSPDAL
jgi:hypothetical protein